MGISDMIGSSMAAIAGTASSTIEALKTVGSSTGAIAGEAAAKSRDATCSAASSTIEAVKTIGSSTGSIAGEAAAKSRDATWSAASSTIEAVKTIGSSTGAIAGEAAAKGMNASCNAASWIKERAPDREAREKIGRLGFKVVDHALMEVTRPYTAGIPVYRLVKEEYFGDNLKNQPVKNKNKNLELQETLKRLAIIEKELMEIKQKKSDQKAQIKNQRFPKFVNWKPIEWNFVIE